MRQSGAQGWCVEARQGESDMRRYRPSSGQDPLDPDRAKVGYFGTAVEWCYQIAIPLLPVVALLRLPHALSALGGA
jgi:hypothetical protein